MSIILYYVYILQTNKTTLNSVRRIILSALYLYRIVLYLRVFGIIFSRTFHQFKWQFTL